MEDLRGVLARAFSLVLAPSLLLSQTPAVYRDSSLRVNTVNNINNHWVASVAQTKQASS